MKKLIVSLMCFLAVGTFALTSAGAEETDAITFQVENLIRQDLFGNSERIAELASNLSVAQRQEIFNKCQMPMNKVWLPFGLNLGVGFGIGSFIQGNVGGGVGQLVLELGGLGSMIAAEIIIYKAFGNTFVEVLNSMINNQGDPTKGNYDSFNYGLAYAGAALYIGGEVLLTCGRVMGCVLPFTYRNKYNKTLSGSLSTYGVQAVVVPTIDPANNSYGLVAAVRF